MNKDILPPKSAMATSRPILLLLALVALQVANVAAFTPALGKFSHQWKRSAGAQRAGRGGASATSLISCARALKRPPEIVAAQSWDHCAAAYLFLHAHSAPSQRWTSRWQSDRVSVTTQWSTPPSDAGNCEDGALRRHSLLGLRCRCCRDFRVTMLSYGAHVQSDGDKDPKPDDKVNLSSCACAW